MTPTMRDKLAALIAKSEALDAKIAAWQADREVAESLDEIAIVFCKDGDGGYDSSCPKVKAAILAEIDDEIRSLQTQQRRLQPRKVR